MTGFLLEEAQLYRMLVAFFGAERVIPHMSLLAVCGGEVPARISPTIAGTLPADLVGFARGHRCLFTIVNEDDSPRMVLDFEAADPDAINADRLEYQRVAEPMLAAVGVRFVTITGPELTEMLKPGGNLDLFSLLRGRFEDFGFSFGPGDGPVEE